MTDLFHHLVGKLLHNRLSSKPQVDSAVLHHEEGSVVEDTSSEKSFQNEFLAFKQSVNLDDSLLKEVQRGGIIAGLLEDFTLLELAGAQAVDDIEKGLLFQLGKVRDLFHTLFDEA